MTAPPDIASALDDAEVAVAWLFGSRAREDHHPDSDADVAVLMRPGVPPMGLRTQSVLVDVLRRRFAVPSVDIVVLDRAPLELQARVVQEGRVIHSTDEPLRVAVTVGIQGRWGDVEPALEAMDRAYLRRLAMSGFSTGDEDG